MSTSALITLHGLNKGHNGKSAMHTVTLYRHCDGDMNRTFAAFLYAAMDNPFKAKGGLFDAFMCADPSQVEYYDQLSYTVDDCCSDYHYHLDAETLQLVVNHTPFNKEPNQVFSGGIDEFINTYSCETKAMISYDQYAHQQKTCLTRDGIIRTVNKCFADIQRLNQPLNPNHKNWCKTVDRMLIILDDMTCTPELREWRKSSMDLSMGYCELTRIKENQQAIQATKDELNTTYVMIGDKPVSITTLD